MNLSDYFIGVSVKTLAPTEVDPAVSRGHEFQGIQSFQKFLGPPPKGVRAKRIYPATYLWLTDDQAPVRLDLTATWYDARANQPLRSAEPRLLYPTAAEDVVYRARGGDTLFLCLTRDERLMIMACPRESAIEQQLLWLLGLTAAGEKLVQRDMREGDTQQIGLAARYVLELIEIEALPDDDGWLDELLERFGSRFPTTAEFSKFARETAGDVDILSAPDAALMCWLEHEERLFLTLEKHIIAERLRGGFVVGDGIDVDGFMQFSLSVQNRRKSRAGYALENHLQTLFKTHGLKVQRGGQTEGKKKPDFLFPGSTEYHSADFPRELLTLLGSKSSCKDRWRQVLSEGEDVELKHLITLEPGISIAQTHEMQAAKLQLVLPQALHESYHPDQRSWLMSVEEFLAMVDERQRRMPDAAT